MIAVSQSKLGHKSRKSNIKIGFIKKSRGKVKDKFIIIEMEEKWNSWKYYFLTSRM